MKVTIVILSAAMAACNSSAPPAAPAAAPVATSSAGEPPMPADPAVMDQISKQFLPHTLLARVGQPVEFRNSEDMPHNVSVVRRESGSEVFSVGTDPHQKYVHTFDRFGEFDVTCDSHEGMEATVDIVD